MRTDIQKAIQKARSIGAGTEGIREMLTRYPYLLTYDEALEELSKSGTIPILKITEPPTLQEGVPPARNYTATNTNRKAVKLYALELSRVKRRGKFERMAKSFARDVESELEALIRGIGGPILAEDVAFVGDFVNRKHVSPKIVEQLNRAVRRIIYRKVMSHPSIGKTLK